MDQNLKIQEHWLNSLDQSTCSQVLNAWYKENPYEDEDLQQIQDNTLSFLNKDLKNITDGLDMIPESEDSQ